MTEKFEQWAIVELFGHQRIAGKVTEQEIGGCAFLRVDVPETEGSAAFTKLYGNGAIYAMTFVDEAIARAAVARITPEPVQVYGVEQLALEAKPEEKAPWPGEEHDDAGYVDDDGVPCF